MGRANDSDQAETLACVGHILVKGCHLVGGLCTGTIGLEAIQIVLNKLWIEVQRFDAAKKIEVSRCFLRIHEEDKQFLPQDFFVRNVRLARSEEHTSELQSLMRISYAVFCLKKKN